MLGELPAVTVPSVAEPRSGPSGRAKAGLSRASASSDVSRRGPSSTDTTNSRPFASRTVTGAISALKAAGRSAAMAFWWLVSARCVLVGPADGVTDRDTLGVGAHVAILEGAPQAVMDRRVHQASVTQPVAEAGMGQQERGGVHVLHPTGHGHARIAGPDLGRGQHDRLHARATDAVDRRRAGRIGQATGERCLAGRILAGARLDHLAHQDLVDRRAIRQAGSLERGANRHPAKPGGRDAAQSPAELADRGARGADDEDRAVTSGGFVDHRLQSTPGRRRARCPRPEGPAGASPDDVVSAGTCGFPDRSSGQGARRRRAPGAVVAGRLAGRPGPRRAPASRPGRRRAR